MTRYVTRKISKNIGKIIIPPTPEEILDDNFNYPDYIEHILNLECDYDLLEEFFDRDETKFTPVDPRVTEAFKEFENSIIVLQRQYEDEIKTGTLSLDYNQVMKKIAQVYFNKLKTITTLKLQEEKKFQALTAKRSELLNTLNKVVDIKSNIEADSDKRIQAFINGEILLRKLYCYDLERAIKKSEAFSRRRIILERYHTFIFANLIKEDGVSSKPIEELNFRRKRK